MVGRDLRFGMVIQLLHYTSRKHLSTSRQQSNGLFGNRVLLDDHAGDMGCFRIKPKLKVHNEGEKVHSGDPVILEDMLTGQQLCLGSPLPEIEQEVVSVTKLRGGRRESALSAFKIRVFRSWEDRQSKDALVGGMPCTLFHTESDCYLGSRLGQSNAIELLAGPAPTSASFFQVFYEDDHVGAICEWDGTFRIQHVATGNFLSVMKRDGAAAQVEGSGYSIALVDGRGQDASDNKCFFRFEPQYDMSGAITIHQFLRIVHDAPDGSTTLYFNAPEPDLAGGGTLQLTLTAKQMEAGVFAVRSLRSETAFIDLKYVVNSIAPFSDFLGAARKAPTVPAGGMYASEGASNQMKHPLPMADVLQTIIDLIYFVTESTNLDPLTRVGTPIKQRQRILCEQGIIQLVIDCVEAPFEVGLYRHQDLELKEGLRPALMEQRMLGLLAMRLVQHILHGQSRNKLASLPQAPRLLNLLGGGYKTSNVLTELFTDNDMVDQVPDETIQMFVNMIRYSMPTP